MTKNTIDHEDIIDGEILDETTLTKRERVQVFVSKHGKKIALGTGAVVSAFVLGRLFERSSVLDLILDITDAQEDDSEDEEEFEEIETTEED